MEEWLSNLTVREIIQIVLAITAAVSAFIEWDKKIPFHPISFVAKGISSFWNKDLYSKIDQIEKQQAENIEAIKQLDQKIDERFDENTKENDEKEAKRLRANIIAFSDSCRVHNKHTKNHFENVIRDYDDYMAYCNKHDIPNHYIDAEYKYIQTVYQECLKNNSFL